MTGSLLEKNDKTSSSPQVATDQEQAAPTPGIQNPQRNLPNRFNATMRRSFSSLRHRNYRLYFIGHLLSTIGSWAQRMAASVLVYNMTGRESMLGIVGAAGTAPMTLLAVVGGLVAERFQRRWIIMFTQIAAAIMPAVVAMMLIFWPDHVSIGLLIAMTLTHGTIMAFDVPARQAFVIEMVGKNDLPNAVALNSMIFNLSRTLGPVIGSLLLLLVGPAACFIANAASYFLLVAALLMMKMPPVSRAHQRGARMRHPLGGFFYVATHKAIGLALILLASLSIFAWSMITIMPSLADRHFSDRTTKTAGTADSIGAAGTVGNIGDSAAAADARLPRGYEKKFGWTLGLFGFGAFIGASFMSSVDSRRRRQPLVIAGLIMYAVGITGITSVNNLVLAALPLVITGVGMLLAMIGISSFIQMNVSNRFRGRVMGLYTLCFAGLMPVGSLYIGIMAEWLGPATAIRINLFTLLIIAALVLPKWHKADPELPAAKRAASA